MQRPVVSIVLPCFNAAGTLTAAVESIRAQSFPAWELIIFDDGSTDASGEIAREQARADARIRVVPSAHVGIVEALRRGCAEARGEFIARMDADDAAHPDRLALQLELMRADSMLALCGAQVAVVGQDIGYGRRRYAAWINSLVTHEAIVRELFVECPIPHPTFLVRRAPFEQVGGYQNCGWAEDYDLCMRLFLAGERFGKVPRPLLDWTESPRRLSMVSPRYAPARFRELKRHYLFLSYLRGRTSFHQWGAGEVGKAWLREWEGPRPRAVADIDPRKIGRVIHGAPVIPPEDLPPPGTDFIVVAVGAPNARDEIRGWLTGHGYRELADFLFLA
jgi:glycosyltransferase involved in cell wall biosynthesis